METYSSDAYQTDGRPDIGKIEPPVCDTGLGYWTLRSKPAGAFQVGKGYKP